MKPTVWAIRLKGLKQDAKFGFNKYVWATKEQGNKILNMQYDDTKKDLLVVASGVAFRPTDIEMMREISLEEAQNYASFDPNIHEPALLEFKERQEAAKYLHNEQYTKLINKWSV